MEWNSYVSKGKPTVCLNFITKIHKTSSISICGCWKIQSFRRKFVKLKNGVCEESAPNRPNSTRGIPAWIVYSTVYPGSDQRNYQSSVSLAFVWGIHRWPVNSPHKGPVTRKTFPFDDVIMIWTYAGFIFWRIYASLGLSELHVTQAKWLRFCNLIFRHIFCCEKICAFIEISNLRPKFITIEHWLRVQRQYNCVDICISRVQCPFTGFTRVFKNTKIRNNTIKSPSQSTCRETSNTAVIYSIWNNITCRESYDKWSLWSNVNNIWSLGSSCVHKRGGCLFSHRTAQWYIRRIPGKDYSHKSHNTPAPYHKIHNSQQKCEYLCSKQCILGICDRCTKAFVNYFNYSYCSCSAGILLFGTVRVYNYSVHLHCG